ncbi:MAG: DNA topoisomerase I [Actinobacteria bacterium]|nr:DNA topoisomerase I [Actinomycetota bacterium]MBU4450903.1 DNA topoisomerase I [Actinomycetota bacterium]MCG2788453.1 DNA topoisomerase I [Actinomycetes bacterium]
MKLIISEKEIAAKRIASILSGNGQKEEKVYGVSVYHIKLGKDECAVIGLKGHILKVDFPKEYSNWFKVDPVDLIDAEIEKTPIHKNIVQALKKVAGDASEVIIATDFDREGELIGYDAWQVAIGKNSLLNAKRAKFSAITNSDIGSAFAKLEKLDLNLAFAGRARQDIDLIWGAVLTRFISLASYQVKENFLSVGRVQSPTLTLIVDREMEIQAFVTTPYWVVNVKLKTDRGEEFEATHKKKRFLKKEEASKAFSKISGEGEVLDVNETIRSIAPPTPFNTTSLIVSANSIGFTAAKTINIAENLYMNGYISYPRTDNTVYTASIDLQEITKMLKVSGSFADACSDVLKQSKIIPSRGKKRTTDHPPIYPTFSVSRQSLSSDEWKLYELIVRRFLCTLLPPAQIKSITANINVSGEVFVANGSNIIKENWIKHYPYYKHEDVYIPNLVPGQKLKIIDREMLDKETKPPARYTQGKLVEKMEELGLGTKATRHTIIQTLISRGYIRGNPLVPSEKAIAVVKILKKHAEKISSPDMTSELEMDMDGIARGDETKDEVVEKSREMLKDVMVNLKNVKADISQEIKKAVKEDFIIGKCRQKDCDGNLIVRVSKKSKKRFIGCSAYPKCTSTFSLPQLGMILPTKDKCKRCDYPVIRIITKGRKPWDLCINGDCPGKDEKYKNYKSKKPGQKSSD